MNTRLELKGKVKRAKDLTDEEIDKMRWEHIQPLVDFEYALLKIRCKLTLYTLFYLFY